MKPPRFGIHPGRVLAGGYTVDRFLGSGWEGEVYLVIERLTGAHRAAKIFFPERNPKDKAASHYARKLEHLRDCSIIIQYHHSETVRLRGQSVTMLLSEFVEGMLLDDHIKTYPGRRMPAFEALHMLRTLAGGLAEIHEQREYHGDLHAGNILVRRRGIHIDAKLIDLHDDGRATASHIREDVCQIVRVFYDLVGGQKHYAKQPPVVKSVCCGLKRSLIKRRFPTAWHLCRHLDTVEW
ncbi:MAG: protein kinase [Phycisphaerales bacterium]|nr:protein kinase [Phycisphaerales bacterium]